MDERTIQEILEATRYHDDTTYGDEWHRRHFSVETALGFISGAPRSAAISGASALIARAALCEVENQEIISGLRSEICALRVEIGTLEHARFNAMTANNVIARIHAATMAAKGSGKQVKLHILSELDSLVYEYEGEGDG